jgi:predicted metal-dependent hydrolase
VKLPGQRRYANGEVFPYKGRSLVLKTEELDLLRGKKPKVQIADGGYLLVSAPVEEIRKFLLFWYTDETEKIVRTLLPEWSKRLSVRPRLVEVKYAKTRWGSCSINGRIFFNSRLAMLSDDVAEYVVVHELCHLKQMNHSPAFWDEVKSALPGAMALRRSLREQEQNTAL